MWLQNGIFQRRVKQLQDIVADAQLKRVEAEAVEDQLTRAVEEGLANVRKSEIARAQATQKMTDQRQNLLQAHALEISAMTEEVGPLKESLESATDRSTQLAAQLTLAKSEMVELVRAQGRAEVRCLLPSPATGE